jgi:hypothetical protein
MKLLASGLTCLFILIGSYQSIAQNFGNSLAFHTAITLSNDTTAYPPVGTVLTKSYTVPAGSVLKITGGRLNSPFSDADRSGIRLYVYTTTLKIDNNSIFGQGEPYVINYGTSGTNFILAPTAMKISSDEAIWVPEGKTVTLTTTIKTTAATAVFNCWITGVVFKLVGN